MADLLDQFSDAAVYGDFDTVKQILATNPEIVNLGDKWGFTALHNMMSEDQYEILQYLIDHGANVNCVNDEGIAPLHLACYVENAKLLLEAGAEIDQPDNQGRTPLHIHAAEGNKSIEIIEFLIQRGARTDIKDKFGMLPIDISVSREDKKVIKIFKRA